MTRAIAVLLSLFVAATLIAEEKPLTRRERKERIAQLDEKHRQFLIDVEPIIIEGERDTFLRLETAPQRETFIDDFWRRRDIARGVTNFAARAEYYERLEFVKENFKQVSSDRGRIYLVHGAPLQIVDVKCSEFQPMQVWIYEHIQGFGSDFILLFYVPRFQENYLLWNPFGDPGRAMQELISNEIDASGRPDLMRCAKGEYAGAGIASMTREGHKLPRLFEPPPINHEDVNRILRSVVIADPKAPKLTADVSVAYPFGDGSKTDMQLTIYVPRAQLKTTTAGTSTLYTIEVVGEVLRDEKMWERYRYRFDFPADTKDEKLPIVIDRMLRPAQYLSRVKISDPASGAQTVLETPLTVPEVAMQQKQTAETATLKTIHEDLQSTRASLRIVPLTNELNGGVTSGVQTIQTMVSGQGIKAVEFWLDGKKVATRRVPPYTLDLDFGTVPRSRRIRVVAIDSHDQPITGDEVVVNSGTDP
ncbi:MAG TPA: GWxTD domain-containing protein, partial [Thermoanaerobaculia bacterium]|nr:GWxTD domain-containing protein [Thermoanaerobaculia bacterium]